MYHILLIEDDVTIREELGLVLSNAGYQVSLVEQFFEVAEQVKQRMPQLILLDINLPGEDGYHICTKIRAFSDVPIIFVTSRNTDMDELQSMMLGGDDFVTKPYNTSILLLRIATILRRAYKDESRVEQRYGRLVLNIESGKLSLDGNEIELTKCETRMLAFLFRGAGRIVTRNELIDYLWDNQLFVDDNTLSVNMTRIRGKLAELGSSNFIKTKYGQGYYVEKETE